jgi:HrpA-like RNA helicase
LPVLAPSPQTQSVLNAHFQQHPITASDLDESGPDSLLFARSPARHPRHSNRAAPNMAASHAQCRQRMDADPGWKQRLQARKKLPAWAFKDSIPAMVAANQVSLVSGETGCGKSTQVPQFLLDDPSFGPNSKIVVTQPRRIAAIALAERIAHERSQQAGGQVGCSIRLESKIQPL